MRLYNLKKIVICTILMLSLTSCIYNWDDYNNNYYYYNDNNTFVFTWKLDDDLGYGKISYNEVEYDIACARSSHSQMVVLTNDIDISNADTLLKGSIKYNSQKNIYKFSIFYDNLFNGEIKSVSFKRTPIN